MDDRKPSAVKSTHNFVPAETYLRERPLCVSLLDMATMHVLESKRLVRSMADFTSAYYLNGKR